MCCYDWTSSIIDNIFGTIFGKNLVKLSLCVRNECVKYFLEQIDQSISIINATVTLLVAIATVGGIFVAVSTYRATVKTNSLSSHLSHLAAFQSYVTSEINKHERLSAQSFDLILWYVAIYPKSRVGSLEVSIEYMDFGDKLATVIGNGNKVMDTSGADKFRFMPHQQSLIELMKNIGVQLERHHRKAWYEVEDDLLSLINAVHRTFNIPILIPARRYL